LWPGFGENARVLEWILDRVDAQVPATETPLGFVPIKHGLNTVGLTVSSRDLDELFRINREDWLAEADLTEQFFDSFGTRVPAALTEQLNRLRARLQLPA